MFSATSYSSQCQIDYVGKPRSLQTLTGSHSQGLPWQLQLLDSEKSFLSAGFIYIPLTRFWSQSLCFMLWCLFKLTVSSVVLFWPRVTFSSGDLLCAGTNCIITKAMAVNVLLQENIRISFMHKLIDLCTLILLRWQPYLLFFFFSYCGVKKSIQEREALRSWISYVSSLKDSSLQVVWWSIFPYPVWLGNYCGFN